MTRPALLVFLLVAAVAGLPHLRGHLAPPPGYVFNGGLLSHEDFYNYLGYVQQAEDGRLLLGNKLDTGTERRVMLNPEWWLAGRVSAALGRQPVLGFGLVGLLATAALVAAVDRWLRRAGIEDQVRARALLLVFFGGGLGGLRYLVFGPPAWRSLDLIAGLYPFVEIVSNPHFVTATALLCLALLCLMRDEDWRWQFAGILLGTLLALSRPYDLVLLVGIRTLGVLLSAPPSLWPRRLLPLAGLLPAVAYLYWLFYVSGAFSSFFSGYVGVAALDLAVALGPAALLVACCWRPLRRGAPGQAAEAHLAAWALLGLLLVLVRPVGFYFQALVGIGVPLLGLAAIGLSRRRRLALLAAAALMASTSLTALHVFMADRGGWYTPRTRMEAAVALRAACGPGDVALAPPDIGLLALAWSPCRPWISERLRPPSREAELALFYGASTPAWRSSLLDADGVAAVLLPAGPGDPAVTWLGAGTPFRQVAVVGRPPTRLAVLRRQPAPR
jgi:hypothetical protein